MTVAREDILKALDQVVDPASGRTVVQQDMIQGLVVKDGHVGFVLEVAAGRGPSSEPLRKICEAMVLGVKGVKSVTAVLTAHEEHHDDHAGHQWLHRERQQCLDFDRYHELFGIRYPFGEYHQAFVPEFNAAAMDCSVPPLRAASASAFFAAAAISRREALLPAATARRSSAPSTGISFTTGARASA